MRTNSRSRFLRLIPIMRCKNKNMGRIMTIFEAFLFLLSIAGVMCLVVKAYEWRQDVLYGPYIRPFDPREMG
jgi:hypothetical protein